MINLDPKLVDQDAVRHAKRKRLLKIATAPIVLLVLFSIMFTRYGVYTVATKVADGKNNFDFSSALSQGQKFVNLFETHIASFNAGVAKLRLHDFTAAEAEFTESLRQDPPATVLCQIYVNLSYSIEMQGDNAYNSADYDRALELYGRAQSTLYNNDCAEKDGAGGKDTRAEQADDRIGQKHKNAVQRANGDEEGSDSGSGDGNNEATDEEVDNAKQNRIDSNAVQSYIDRVRLKELKEAAGGESGGGAGGGYNNTTPRW